MKKIILSFFISLSVSSAIHSQQLKIIDDSKLMEIGTYYYPEQWPENEWERDLKKMRDLGMEFTHYGEFAWSRMEPEEGKYDFEWLDKAVNLAAKYNLKVILCTPTPTPPVWLTQKHPDILIENSKGRVIQHGGRQQASWNSEIYRQYVEKIVTILAKRYANNKAVWGWQIDNEPSHYSSFDYSDNAQQGFRKWLQNKYQTIDKLNDTWGTAFWSQTYNNFEQIIIPNGEETLQKPNPHALLDFKRFTADAVSDFVVWQQSLLKKYIPHHQWVTTNLMADHSIVDPLRFKDLDFVTYTKYLVAGFDMGHGEQGFRMGSSNGIGFANDWFRNITGNTAVMELQPGQVNWGWYNPQTMKGTVRMWIYHVLAGGNKFVCNYRFRQPLTGLEQYHYGIMQTDGTSVSTSGEEYVKFANELKILRKKYNPNATAPTSYLARRTAILYNTDSRWEMEHQPQTPQWDYIQHVNKYYKILQSFVAPVDVIDDSHDFSEYPFLIAPAYQLLDKKIIDRWKRYIENGGHLILTCRTGQKDREAHLWNEKLSAPIYELIGAKQLFFDMLPESRTGHVMMNGKDYSWNNWADIITPTEDTDVLGIYSDQFYKGKAAITNSKLGKGTITFIGVDSDDSLLESAVLKEVYNSSGVETENLPEGVIKLWKHGFWIGMNYSSEVKSMDIPSDAEVIIGEKKLQPAEVVVWR